MSLKNRKHAMSGIDTVFTCPNCTIVADGTKFYCPEHGGAPLPTIKEATPRMTTHTSQELADLVKSVTAEEDKPNVTQRVLGGVSRGLHKVKPTKEGVSDKAERTISFAVTNPVTATAVATVSTLANPFKVERKGAKQAYAQQRRYSHKLYRLDEEVRECENCDATFGIETAPRYAGDKGFMSGKERERDVFCDDHKDAVRKAQRTVHAAKGMYL